MVIFLFAGGADMVWHTIFGVEANLAAALSPSHLLLAVGAVLLLTSPLRSWWAEGCPKGLPAAAGVAGLALGTTALSVFLTYASAFYPGWPLQSPTCRRTSAPSRATRRRSGSRATW